MLKRLLYREAPFERLSADQLQRLDTAFRGMVSALAPTCYWVHRLDAQRLLITDFFHPSMLRYRGLEVVLVENGSISYFRLPGAKVGGTGQVPVGRYQVCITAPSGASFLLDVCKNHLGRFEMQALAPLTAATPPSTHAGLPRHVLEPSKFADEMKGAIARGVEWTYRSIRQAHATRQTDLVEQLRAASWLRAAQGICPEVDAYLWMLNQPITWTT
ncbi:hypothetical protein RBA41_17405 [Massilia sp. CCM 9210]|uniref:hypothetical protein n=1 Tax=Massilia scottii TaxID=3057166 RepID=UPI0027965BFA|nr:hypothetical protein [Massilia sp. CCM 9210]MDQ1815077.1 hypothetical protein [Massilia sp. CCM 9210]